MRSEKSMNSDKAKYIGAPRPSRLAGYRFLCVHREFTPSPGVISRRFRSARFQPPGVPCRYPPAGNRQT